MPGAFLAFLIVLYAWGFTLLGLIRHFPDREKPEFGLTAVGFVSYLTVLCIFTGFSIGGILAILNVLFGLSLASVSTHYRRPILFATLTSFLLASYIGRDWFPYGAEILQLLLAITALGAAVRTGLAWWNKEKETCSGAGLVMVACCAGLAIISSWTLPSIAIGLFSFAAVACTLFWILTNRFRVSFFVVGTVSILWVTSL